MEREYRNIYRSARETAGLTDLTRLAADGKISGEEVLAYGEAIQELRDLVAAAYELEYAEEAQ